MSKQPIIPIDEARELYRSDHGHYVEETETHVVPSAFPDFTEHIEITRRTPVTYTSGFLGHTIDALDPDDDE
jgi:hypothetical protein